MPAPAVSARAAPPTFAEPASRCVVNAEDVMTVPKSLVRRRIASLSADRMAELEAAIRFALDVR